MSIDSPCRIELQRTGEDAVTLVDVGDMMPNLPRFSMRQGMFETDGIMHPTGYFRPLGGVVVSITFSVEIDRLSGEEMWGSFLSPEWIDGVDLLQGDGVVIITGDDHVATYPAAAAKIVPSLPGPLATNRISYEIVAGLPTIEAI